MNYSNYSNYNDIEIPFAYGVVQGLLSILSLLLILCGNCMVIITLAMNRKLLHPMNAYIASMSASGIVCGVLIFANIGYFTSPFAIFAIQMTCVDRKILGIIFCAAILNSVLCMLAIAVERYQVIVQMKQSPCTSNYRKHIICGLWVISFIYNLPICFINLKSDSLLFTRSNSEEIVMHFCLPTGIAARIHFTISVLFSYLMPLILMAFMYYRVISVIMENIKKTHFTCSHMNRIKLRAVKVMIFIVVIFAICWLPGHILQVVSAWFIQSGSIKYIIFHDLALHTAFAHNWIHTIVYPTYSKLFRMSMLKIFSKTKKWFCRSSKVKNAIEVVK